LQVNSDIVRRWNNEVQEAMSSKNPVVQFHAISLLHKIRQSDRLAITKLVSQLTRNSVRSPLAHSLIIRYVSKVIFFLFKLLLSLLIKT
jgi:coatomer protein complex subunit gamma